MISALLVAGKLSPEFDSLLLALTSKRTSPFLLVVGVYCKPFISPKPNGLPSSFVIVYSPLFSVGVIT